MNEADAKLIYDYHRMHLPLKKADAIFCLCSIDTRVAERAAQLLLDGYGDYLIFSGGLGRLTQDRFEKPEAEVFADIARAMGVPDNKLVLEPNSTNTGENVRFTHAMLQGRNLPTGSFILVQKPFMERRTYATFRRQWPDPSTEFTVTSPLLEYAQYPDDDNPKELMINILVGDLVRVKEYPAMGFQIEQEIPDEVWAAGQRLIKAGYVHHLPYE